MGDDPHRVQGRYVDLWTAQPRSGDTGMTCVSRLGVERTSHGDAVVSGPMSQPRGCPADVLSPDTET